ncbi:MAG TPA: hypothetical protein VGE97_04350 [Nitrososphaera sp.]
MRFNKHLNLLGEHAFLSPSQYHWIHYSRDRLIDRWTSAQAAMYGTLQHEYAHREIKEGRLSDLVGTVGLYINDAIKYKMTCEQPLYYSENCFGTADTISFRYNVLRIHDLKTGVYPASVHQLEIYAALFCLEYDVDPFKIKMELRLYQSNEVQVYDADPEDVAFIMEKIIEFDKILTHHKLEEES